MLKTMLNYAVFNAPHICATFLQSIHEFQILLFIDNFSHTIKKRDNPPIAGSIKNHAIPQYLHRLVTFRTLLQILTHSLTHSLIYRLKWKNGV